MAHRRFRLHERRKVGLERGDEGRSLIATVALPHGDDRLLAGRVHVGVRAAARVAHRIGVDVATPCAPLVRAHVRLALRGLHDDPRSNALPHDGIDTRRDRIASAERRAAGTFAWEHVALLHSQIGADAAAGGGCQMLDARGRPVHVLGSLQERPQPAVLAGLARNLSVERVGVRTQRRAVGGARSAFSRAAAQQREAEQEAHATNRHDVGLFTH